MDKADKGKSSKLTGCIQSGTTAGTYELTNIKGKGSSSSSESASSSSSSSTPSTSSSSSKSVKLVAAAGVDLSQHVGHQVEVSGSYSAGGSSSSSPSSSATPSASSSSGDKEFNVTDVKMVSATCSAGTN